MSSFEARESQDLAPDHPRRLLMVAYTRLCMLPLGPNGAKSTTIAAFGDHVVRLIELASSADISPIWVELYDAAADYALDGAGCDDVSNAVTAAETLLEEAKSLNARLARRNPTRTRDA
jgi:hypothetical protein